MNQYEKHAQRHTVSCIENWQLKFVFKKLGEIGFGTQRSTERRYYTKKTTVL